MAEQEPEEDPELIMEHIQDCVEDACQRLADLHAAGWSEGVCEESCSLFAWNSSAERKKERKELRRLARTERHQVRSSVNFEACDLIDDERYPQLGDTPEEREHARAFARVFARRHARRELRKHARRAARQAVRYAQRQASIVFYEPVAKDESSDDSEVSSVSEGSSSLSSISDRTSESSHSQPCTWEEEFDVVAPLKYLCRRVIREHYTLDEISQFSPFFHRLLFAPPHPDHK